MLTKDDSWWGGDEWPSHCSDPRQGKSCGFNDAWNFPANTLPPGVTKSRGNRTLKGCAGTCLSTASAGNEQWAVSTASWVVSGNSEVWLLPLTHRPPGLDGPSLPHQTSSFAVYGVASACLTEDDQRESLWGPTYDVHAVMQNSTQRGRYETAWSYNIYLPF